MTATKRLVLDLPADQVDMIEARVASGEFASPSALVTAELDEAVVHSSPGEMSPEWLAFAESCRDTLERLDAGLEPTYTADEVRTYLAQQRAARAARRA